MTKAGFLQKLTAALAELPETDRESAIAFFTEQLDDRIEDGMTEAEAIDSLGAFDEIIRNIKVGGEQTAEPAVTATEAGKSNRPEPRSYTAEQLPHKLMLREDNCAVELHPSSDGQLRIDYEVTRWINVTIEQVGDTLTYTAKEIFHLLHWDVIGRKPVRIYLPAGLACVELRSANARITAHDVSIPDCRLHTSNASITVENLTADTLDAKTGNGKLTATALNAKKAVLHTSNATLAADHITAGDLTLRTANGTVRAEHITATTLDATTANGKNVAANLTVDTIKLVTSNGRIDLQNVEGARDITLITSNGSITATLPGSIADYRITSSGGALPRSKNSGEKSLAAKTSNGKINVDFVGDR